MRKKLAEAKGKGMVKRERRVHIILTHSNVVSGDSVRITRVEKTVKKMWGQTEYKLCAFLYSSKIVRWPIYYRFEGNVCTILYYPRISDYYIRIRPRLYENSPLCR